MNISHGASHYNTPVEKSDFFRKLQDGQMSKQQRRVANYLAHNYRIAASQTSAEIAAAIGTSEATVIRFSREIGYPGFRQLRRQLHWMIRKDLTSLELLAERKTRKDNNDALTDEIEKETVHLRQLSADIRREDFQRVVKGLVDASKVYIVGHRASASLAQFCGYTLSKIHPNVITLTGDGTNSYDPFRDNPPGSLMVAIGFARYPRDTCELMEFAREQGVSVVAITDRILSPLAQRADFSLVVGTRPLSFVDSHCAPQALIAAMLVEYGQIARKRTERMLERFESIVKKRSLFHGPEDKSVSALIELGVNKHRRR